MTNLRFAITGGPGAGKTTILSALAGRGYIHAPESARAIIRKRLVVGLSARPQLEQFGKDILRMDIARYRETPVINQPVFFDRGVIDALYVLDQQSAISSAKTEAHIKSFPYNEVVFLMPSWKDIYSTDAERDQTFAESIEVSEGLRKWYARWGYETVEMPRADISKRVDFVLQAIKCALTNEYSAR